MDGWTHMAEPSAGYRGIAFGQKVRKLAPRPLKLKPVQLSHDQLKQQI